MQSGEHSLDPQWLDRLASLPVKAQMIVDRAVSGLHRANLHGSSVEFADHKQYSPGDEMRHVDWKAYAKLDRYYVKQYEQESQLTLYLALDASASMNFRERGFAKLDYAALSLAALGHLVIHQQDTVGLVASSDREIDAMVPPRAGKPHLRELLSVLDQLIVRRGAGDRSPAHALARIAELTRRRRSLIVLASDLFDPEDKTVSALVALRSQGHDVVALHVLAPEERTFPYAGLTEFSSLESSATRLVNPAAIRTEYVQRMNAFCTSCRETFAQAGVNYHAVTTDHPLEQTLVELVIARQGLRSRRGPRTA